MGTYGISAQEIADQLDSMEFEKELQGDFSEDGFREAASLYCDMLRERGAFILDYSAKKTCEECGRSVDKEKCPFHKKPNNSKEE